MEMSIYKFILTSVNFLILLAVIIVFWRVMRNGFGLEKKIVKAMWTICFIIVSVSPFVIPVKVVSEKEFEVLRFGFPSPFIEQHTLIDMQESNFPFYTTLLNPWGHSLRTNINFRLDSYALSYVSLYFLVYLCVYCLNRILSWRKSKEL